jgi:hypothetical protein
LVDSYIGAALPDDVSDNVRESGKWSEGDGHKSRNLLREEHVCREWYGHPP